MKSLHDLDRILVEQNGAAILIGGHAFDTERKLVHKDIDLLLFRGKLPDEDSLDVFTCRQIISGGEICWVNNRSFALDFDLDPEVDNLPSGLWHPNLSTLEQIRKASVHLWYKYTVKVDPDDSPQICRNNVKIPVRINTIYS